MTNMGRQSGNVTSAMKEIICGKSFDYKHFDSKTKHVNGLL